MSINYATFENNLTSDPDDYTALVISKGTVEIDGIIERMLESGSTVVKADIISVLEDYETAIANLLLEGMNVNTPSCNYTVSVKGVFDSAVDSFDSSRHQLLPSISAGKRLRKVIMERGALVKQEAVKKYPNLQEFIDTATGEKNSAATSGGLGQIVGHRLKFEATDPAQGIFFIAEDDSETHVESIAKNKPSELIFLMPTLASGNYQLAVRARFGQDDIRTGTLEQTLSVA